MQRRAANGDRRSFIGLTLAASGLLLSRPEAPLFAGVIGIAEVLKGCDRIECLRRLKRLSLPSIGASLVLAAYFLFRRAYFGLWWPHTHSAKALAGFHWEHLSPFAGEGASWIELAFLAACTLAALWLAIRRRDLLPLLVAAAVAIFVGSVVRDWMPNVRHFLPLQILLPVTIVGAAVARESRSLVVIALGLLVLVSIDVARVDARFSVADFDSHGHGSDWRRLKSTDSIQDTWRCLSGEWPEHVRSMGPYHNGMITQLYNVLQADDRPLEQVVFVGRDIGRVGWLAPVQVFDTDGLFTPEAIPMAEEEITDEMIRSAFERPVAASELIGGWARAYSLAFVRESYEPSPDVHHLGARGLPSPPPRRYCPGTNAR